MRSSDPIDERLQAIFSRELPGLLEVGEEMVFTEHDLLDSVDIVVLISALEDVFGIEIPGDELREENIGSKVAIRRYVEGKVRRAGSRA